MIVENFWIYLVIFERKLNLMFFEFSITVCAHLKRYEQKEKNWKKKCFQKITIEKKMFEVKGLGKKMF